MAVWSNTALSSVQAEFGRFDAEFYKPEFLDSERILSNIDAVKLGQLPEKLMLGT